MSKLSICYATDDNYIVYTSISILSLLKHNSNLDIDFYILENEVSKEGKAIIESIVKEYNRECYWIDVSAELKGVESDGGVSYRGYSTYARIYIDRLLPENVKRILYIDGDTMINGSLEELIKFDLRGKTLAGVKDAIIPEYKQAIHFEQTDVYINAGVLLIDRISWRTNKCERLLLDNISRICACSKMPDQDLLNIVLREKITFLPLKFNVYDMVLALPYNNLMKVFRMEEKVYYTQEEYNQASSSPIIIHLTCGVLGRPWTNYCINPYKQKWINIYKKKYKREVKEIPARISLKNKLVNFLYNNLSSDLFSIIYGLIRKITGKMVIKKYKKMWSE